MYVSRPELPPTKPWLRHWGPLESELRMPAINIGFVGGVRVVVMYFSQSLHWLMNGNPL